MSERLSVYLVYRESFRVDVGVGMVPQYERAGLAFGRTMGEALLQVPDGLLVLPGSFVVPEFRLERLGIADCPGMARGFLRFLVQAADE